MTTKKIVPRRDEEGGLGTSIKRWLEGWFTNLHCTNLYKDGVEIQELLDNKVDRSALKLSQIEIDVDLNMGDHNIRTNELRAARVYSPIDTDEWPTETLDWGDLPEQTVFTLDTDIEVTLTETQLTEFTAPNKDMLWEVLFNTYSQTNGIELYVIIYVNNEVFDTLTNPGLYGSATLQKQYIIPSNASVVVTARRETTMTGGKVISGSYIKRVGTVLGDTTFDLTNKWLALGLDMKEFTATVKIQGVEMPYSDYPKYFPIAPTEIKISGDWSPTQVRPDIKIYT